MLKELLKVPVGFPMCRGKINLFMKSIGRVFLFSNGLISLKQLFYSVILSLILSTTVLSNDEIKNSVTLTVSLDPALIDNLNPEHTLFIYARAAKGPRMPLAIVKHKAGELPLEVELDATMAMMPQMSLTKFSQVVFIARVSASDQAMTQSGDLLGKTAILEWKMLDKPVAVIINKQL